MKKAIKLMSATPPITPPATAIVELLPLLPLLLPSPVDEDDDDEVNPAPFVACALDPTVDDASPMVVNGVVFPEPKTSLCAAWDVGGVVAAAAGVAVVNGTVDNAAVVVSVTLACGGTATAADNGGCGVEVKVEEDDDNDDDDSGVDDGSDDVAMIENWPIEAVAVVAATGGGFDCSITVFWTAGVFTIAGAGATWAMEVVEIRDVENVLVVLVCVLMSVLGNAVHLLPCNVVMKAPRGRFGLVAMTKCVQVVVYHHMAIPVAL